MKNNIPLNVEEITLNIKAQLMNQHASRYDNILENSSKKFVNKDVYTIEDFTQCIDEEFIENIFYVILKRAPDEEGKNLYLSLLRSNKLSKVFILASIRYSPEGIAHSINILGLKKHYYFSKLSKIFIFRPFIKVTYLFLEILSSVKYIKNYEKYLYQKTLDDKILEDNIRSLKDENIILSQKLQELSNIKQYMTSLYTKLGKLTDLVSEDGAISSKRSVNKELQYEQKNMLDLMYIAFEDKFRGSKIEIKNRLEVYLPYVKKMKNDAYILDVGCGRGEWLELLKENNIKAKGLDLNTPMIKKAKSLGLDVINEDVISYLKKQEDSSIDAITGFHIVEHLPFETMINMFQESLRTIKKGGFVIFETPNPENILVGAHYFYNDPTHKNPLVPVTMEFILEYLGFELVEIKRLHTYAEAAGVNESEDAFLNNNFYNAMDFAVIGYKE